MRTITNDYRDAQILNLGSGGERGPYLVTQTGVSPRDPNPFVPKLYVTPGTREAADANAKAADSQQQARKAGTVSGQYLANTVLFAAVLFFANASSRFEQRRVRIVAFSFAIAVFLFAVVRTAMLPILS